MKIIYAAAAAFVLTCLSSVAVQAAEKVTVSYLATVHSLPLFVAIEEGLFEKAGLDVEATAFENPNQIIDSLVSGRADAAPAGGAAGITALAETRFPGALRVFGLQGSSRAHDASNDTLIVKAGSPIKSFADLKGKKLAHVPGIQWRTIAQTIVKANGLDPAVDVELVEMAIGLHAQAVASGTVDAALTLEPIGSIVAATGDVQAVLDNPAGAFIVDPFWAGAGVVSSKFLTERPAVAKKLIAVMDEAVALIQEDFTLYRKHLLKYTPVTEATIGYVKPMHFIGSSELDEPAIAAYQEFADIFVATGVMTSRVDVSKLVLTPAELK